MWVGGRESQGRKEEWAWEAWARQLGVPRPGRVLVGEFLNFDDLPTRYAGVRRVCVRGWEEWVRVGPRSESVQLGEFLVRGKAQCANISCKG